MDLLIEKGDKRTYLSRYKVITTSFEESSPSVKRNNTQIQYRNGNVDFGGWNEAKTIDYVGYYRADDLEDEEYLRERIYALLSDPDGYYITQLKNDNDDSFERPGETSGDYFDKQVNRPSHKRFYVYASSLESELVGSYGGHVLYKISATFTTMKLPYGESVPRDLDVKPNVPYYGRNYLLDTATSKTMIGDGTHMATADRAYKFVDKEFIRGKQMMFSADFTKTEDTTGGKIKIIIGFTWQSIGEINVSDVPVGANKRFSFAVKVLDEENRGDVYFQTPDSLLNGSVTISNVKLENGTVATDWAPAPEDPEYNAWHTKIYYNTDNLIIPYAGTVHCNQLEQGFTIEFTAKEGGSGLKVDLNGTELTYSGQVYSGDVFKLSGYEYTKNSISIVKATNKAYFKLLPGVTNKISSSIAGTIRILGYQDLYA